MSRRKQHADSGERQGMTRLTRLSLIASVAVFLSLVSGVSFAAWTASSTKTATVATGNVSMATGTAGGTNTISALGAHTYTAIGQTVTKPITIRNTGSVETSVTQVAISSAGTLSGLLVTGKFWVGASSCGTPTIPTVVTTLASGTVSLSSLNMTIAAASLATLCASTTFTGSMSTQAGQSMTTGLLIRTSASANWIADDALPLASRTFTQQIYVLNPPANVQCFPDAQNKNDVQISWTAPVGFTTPNGGYNVYLDGVLDSNTTNTSTTVTGRWLTASVTIRAVASNGALSTDSVAVGIIPSGWGNGITCAS